MKIVEIHKSTLPQLIDFVADNDLSGLQDFLSLITPNREVTNLAESYSNLMSKNITDVIWYSIQLNGVFIKYEISVSNDDVLQIGYYLNIPKKILERRHRILLNETIAIFEGEFGDYHLQNVSNSAIYNFGNEKAVAYCNMAQNAKIRSLIIKIGSRKYW